MSGCALALMLFAVQRSSPAQNTNGSSLPADGRVIGTVVDDKSGQPIAGALVMLGDGRISETDAAGRFLFLHVRPGSHEIAAVARGCAQAVGDFSLVSGRDALLRLEVVAPAPAPRADRSSGTASRVIGAEQLAGRVGQTAPDAVIQHGANTFRMEGTRLALRSRSGGSLDDIVEPLLVVDGMRTLTSRA